MVGLSHVPKLSIQGSFRDWESGLIASRFIGVAAATVLLLSVAPLAAAEVPAISLDGVSALGADDNRCWTYKDSERGFARRINSERTIEGVGKLSLDPELSKVALKHTWEMVRRDDLYHTPSDSLRRRVTNWTILGENVGVGGSVSSLHTAFMNSPDHRDNVLYNTFQHLGIGVVKKAGRMWVTVIFEAVADPGTTLSMPSC